MLRYQGVDWQDRSKWQCGSMVSPHQPNTYDGTSLNPLEVSSTYQPCLVSPKCAEHRGCAYMGHFTRVVPLTMVIWVQVLFIKVKHGPTMIPGTAAHQATKYTQWQSESKQAGSLDITTNVWKTHAYKDLQDRIKLKDPKCFDADYYINNAPWEFEGMSASKAYQHFIQFGFQEGRAYHFTC